MRDKQQTQVFNSVLCRHETCVCGEAIKCTCINWHIISTRMSCLQFFLCRFRDGPLDLMGEGGGYKKKYMHKDNVRKKNMHRLTAPKKVS